MVQRCFETMALGSVTGGFPGGRLDRRRAFWKIVLAVFFFWFLGS